MDKIASFKINHELLNPGLYISRKDYLNENMVITTFDMRVTKPNKEEVMSTGAVHAFEHLGATFLRNDSAFASSVIYFGPMGCRTGFYLLLAGDFKPMDIKELVKAMLSYIIKAEDIPGASSADCGNYSDMDLVSAKGYAGKYLKEVINRLNQDNTNYPE